MLFRNRVTAMAEVIDPDYTSDIKVVLYNYGSEPFVITARQKITQLVLEKFEPTDIEVTEYIRKTTRGSDGFGSTGDNTLPPENQAITPETTLDPPYEQDNPQACISFYADHDCDEQSNTV